MTEGMVVMFCEKLYLIDSFENVNQSWSEYQNVIFTVLNHLFRARRQ